MTVDDDGPFLGTLPLFPIQPNAVKCAGKGSRLSLAYLTWYTRRNNGDCASGRTLSDDGNYLLRVIT